MRRAQVSLVGFDGLISRIRSLSRSICDRPAIIGIDGRSGSGKTLFGRILAYYIERSEIPVSIIDYDFFWRDSPIHTQLMSSTGIFYPSEDYRYFYDWRLARDVVFEKIHAYSDDSERFTRDLLDAVGARSRGVTRGGIVIVEGCTTQQQNLQRYYDVRLFVHLDADQCRSNLEARRNNTVDYDRAEWQVTESAYLASDKPREHADYLILSQPDEKSFLIMAQIQR